MRRVQDSVFTGRANSLADYRMSVRLTILRNKVIHCSPLGTQPSPCRQKVTGLPSIAPPNDDATMSSRTSRMTIVIPRCPLVVSFFRTKAIDGFRSLAGAIFGLTAGVFLATHISTTPNLHLQVTFVSVVCLLLGLSLVPLATACLWGGIQINSRGIRVSPRLIGFDVPWSDLDCWSVEGLQLHLHSNRSCKEKILGLNILTQDQRLAVHEILRNCAPEKERKVAG